MLKLFLPAVLAALTAAPLAAAAATIDASTLPDTTYTVTVQKVVDSKHVTVTLDDGDTATLTAGRPTVDFSKVNAGDQLKLSLSKGQVLVYLDLTTKPSP